MGKARPVVRAGLSVPHGSRVRNSDSDGLGEFLETLGDAQSQKDEKAA